MRTIAICNLKGGVGKTATAVNLAWHASQRGHNTLLWDIDAQGASTWYFTRDDPADSFKAARLVRQKMSLGSLIRKTPYKHLDLIPSDLSLHKMDILLNENKDNLFKEWFSQLGEDYRTIIIDCPPTLSRLTLNILEACDRIIAPALPTPLSYMTVQQMRHVMEENDLPTKKLYPVLTMIDRRKKVHQEFMAKAKKSLGRKPIGFIPYASDVEKMGEHRAPLGTFAPRCPAALAYQLLWENVCKKVL